MRKLITSLSAVSIPLLACALAGPASAQATRTWVSGVGDDANPCSRTAPCKTLPGAISKTAAGGEIDILDPGGFGAVTITKSIAINAEWAGEGGVLVSGTNGITINAAASDVINIRGLFINGIGYSSGSPGLAGIRVMSAGEVHIQDTVIKDFRDATYGYGVWVNPSANNVKVTIENSFIGGNGTASGGGGVVVAPSGTAKATVLIKGSTLAGNTVGVKADGTVGTGAINVQVVDSSVDGSLGQGFFADSASGGLTSLFVDNSSATNNGSPGLRVRGANATATVSRSLFTGNGGPGIQALNGAVLNSYRDNRSNGNGAADSATVALTPQ